ncbi:MAG TPA: MMPL family transporter [Acidimicrobiales bacterium]|nr:MMPL family transporter [Acidimicrobiales bacterium]
MLSVSERLFSAIGRSSVRYRWLVLVAWLAVAVLTSITMPSMGSEVNNDNTQFLPTSAPSAAATKLAAPLLGTSGSHSVVDLVFVRTRGGGLVGPDLRAVQSEAVKVAGEPGVLSARVGGLSRDGRAAQVLAVLRVAPADIAGQKPVVDAMVRQAQRFDGSTSARTLGLRYDVAGDIATNVASQASSAKAGRQVQDFSLVFIVLLLLVIFRSFLAPLITLAPAGVALVVSNRVIGLFGQGGLRISEITQLLLIVLVLGAGTDYGLFLVFRTREELQAGRSQPDAVAHAVARVGESITASAATVVFALLSLLLASFGLYHDLGIPLAMGVCVMLIAGLTLLPALLAIFGRAAFWPARTVPLTGTDGAGTGESRGEGLWGRVAARLVSRPALTLASGALLFLVLSVAALGYHSSGFGGVLDAPKGTDAATGNTEIAAHFPASSSNPAQLVFEYKTPVWRDARPLARAQAVLERSGEFTRLVGPLQPNGSVLSPSEIEHLYSVLGPPASLALPEPSSLRSQFEPVLYDAYRSLVPLVTRDGRVVQWEAELTVGPQSTNAAMSATPAVRDIVSAAARASGAVDSGVTGQAASVYDVSGTSGHDMMEIVPVAILAIGLLLGLLLRSVVAPVYLIVSVGLSYLAALGLATLLFIDIGGSGGITFILPFLMFIFLLALGEDYNILVMTRVREEVRSYPLRVAVVRAVGRTGATVTSAGMVLAGTFGVLAFEAGNGPGSSQVRDMGFGLAVGVLMDTFLVRSLLVPSTVALLGRFNWWPSRLDGPVGPHSGLDVPVSGVTTTALEVRREPEGAGSPAEF